MTLGSWLLGPGGPEVRGLSAGPQSGALLMELPSCLRVPTGGEGRAVGERGLGAWGLQQEVTHMWQSFWAPSHN